jgi:putative hydroxymethylpyrimidine transport system substrate-binding protein
MTRRKALAVLTAVLAVAAASVLTACGKREDTGGTPKTRQLTLILDYLPNPDHVGIYMAQARGEFRKAGLDVKIVTPTDPAAPLKLLAAGRADLAITYEPEILLARDKNLGVLSVGALAQQPLTSLMAVKGHSVDPKKLKGKRVGTAGIPYQEAYLDEILQNAGVDPASVRRVNVGFNLVPAMLSGKVDATLGAFWNVEGVQLRLDHKRPSIAPVDTLGVPPYDELVLAARYDTVQKDGETLRRFMQALQRGTRAARSDPQGAVDALIAAAPDLGRKFTEASVKATIPVLFPEDRSRAFGFQNLQQWQDYADWMRRNNLLTRPVDVGTVATNEFLPGEGLGDAGSDPTAP